MTLVYRDPVVALHAIMGVKCCDRGLYQATTGSSASGGM